PDQRDKRGARVRGGGLIGELTFTVTAKRTTLPAVLSLLGEVLREPTFPAEEFEILKRETHDELVKSLTEPSALASRALRRKLNPYPKEDIRYTPTIEDSLARLEKATRDQVAKIYAEQVGAQAGELVIVGDFDPDATAKQIQEMLGGWKAAVAYERIARPARTDVAGAREEILTPDKANAFYM